MPRSELFGITQRDTFYWALPDPFAHNTAGPNGNANFDVLGQYSRDPNAYWGAFDLDLRCPEGGRLHCLEVFGRQLICALHGIHPHAVPAFVRFETSQAA